MKIIAIDTASTACSAAVADENKQIIAAFELASGRKHSQDFLPGVQDMLRESGLRLDEMDAVAVTVGPGSFTGIRIGLATAKAWGQALDKPLIPVVTLDALAYGVEGLCCPVLDARKNEVYTALYRDGLRLDEYAALSPAALCDKLSAGAEPVSFCGDASVAYASLWQERLGERCRLLPAPQCLFMARSAACLGVEKLLKHETLSALEADAFYLRVSEAEQKRAGQNV